MAPSLGYVTDTRPPSTFIVPKKGSLGNKFGYTPGRTVAENHDHYPHEDLLPRFPDVRWAPIEEVSYEDRGVRGDTGFRNLLADAMDISDYTPKIGTEVSGINLAKLNDAQKDDLARLIAVRGVVFFRGQDEFDIEAQRSLGKHFGQLHKVSWAA